MNTEDAPVSVVGGFIIAEDMKFKARVQETRELSSSKSSKSSNAQTVENLALAFLWYLLRLYLGICTTRDP